MLNSIEHDINLLINIGINTTSDCFKQENNFIFKYFSLYGQMKFHAHLIWAWKSFITLEQIHYD